MKISMNNPSHNIAILVFIFLFLFHTLRNLSIIYLPFLLLFYLHFLFSYVISKQKLPNCKLTRAYLVFLVMTCYVGVVSIIYTGSESLNGIPRLFMAPILVLVLWPAVYKNLDITYRLMTLYVAIFLIAAISLIYQQIFGSVWWFNAPGSPRGGLDRYSSSLGSITIYGAACAFPLLYIFLKKSSILLKFCLALWVSLGALLTSQKAALVNLMFSWSVAYLIFGMSKMRVNIAIVFSFLFLFIVLIIYPNSIFAIYADNILMNTFGFQAFSTAEIRIDDSLSHDRIIERLTGRYSDVLEEHDTLQALTLGLGVVGGGGGMGVSGPQAHDTYWDLALMGGVLYLLIFLALFYFLQTKLRSDKTELGRFFFYSNFLLAVNAAFHSAFIYHPITSFPFWLSIVYTLRSK